MNRAKVRFNGMDAFIIVVLVLVIAAGVYLLSGGSGEAAVTSSKNVEVTAAVELTSQNKEFTETVAVGDVVYVGEKEKAKAVVSKVEVETAKSTGYDILEGQVLRSEIPDVYDVKVSFSGSGVETEGAIELDGSAIRVGQSVVLSSKNWAGEGYVVGLEASDAQ